MEYRKQLATLLLLTTAILTYKFRIWLDKKESEKLEREHKNNLHKNNA